MMIAVAVFPLLIVAGFHFIVGAIFFGECLSCEREHLRRVEEVYETDESDPAQFDQHIRMVADAHAQSAARYSRLKWRYLRAMFEFWKEIPEPPIPEVPSYIPPPTPRP